MTDIKPMLAATSTGASNRQPVKIETLVGTHVFDLKVDGVRAMLYRDPPRLVNRNGVDVTHKYPEIIEAVVGTSRMLILDGEIIADDGRFETTLTRDQQERAVNIKRLAKSSPCRFVAFDTPARMWGWQERRKSVESEVKTMGSDRITVTPYSMDVSFFGEVAKMGMEGVIAKRLTARYQPGRRSPDWVKFKTVRRVTCVVMGYSPGNGSRTHLGALHLAMLDADHNPVDVGRCGAGFTEKQTHEIKALLDANTILCVEIEALNVTSGGKLRHPVYKGIRSDLTPLDCTVDQLDTLPTC